MTSIRLLRALGAALLVSLAGCGGGGDDEQGACRVESFVSIVHAAEGQRVSFRVDAPRPSWFVWWLTINGAVVADGSIRGGEAASASLPAGALVLQVASADSSCGKPAVVIL